MIGVDGSVEPLPSKINRRMVRGELVHHVQSGGGGFGDPMVRDPELVANDVWNEKITVDYARQQHGVVVDADSGHIDHVGTAALRNITVEV